MTFKEGDQGRDSLCILSCCESARLGLATDCGANELLHVRRLLIAVESLELVVLADQQPEGADPIERFAYSCPDRRREIARHYVQTRRILEDLSRKARAYCQPRVIGVGELERIGRAHRTTQKSASAGNP